jgi:hypothetical protein
MARPARYSRELGKEEAFFMFETTHSEDLLCFWDVVLMMFWSFGLLFVCL